MPPWLVFLYLIFISRCICDDILPLPPSHESTPDSSNGSTSFTDNITLGDSDSNAETYGNDPILESMLGSNPTNSTDPSSSEADPFVVVVKKSNSTKSALARHIKWLHEVSDNTNIPSHLSHNITSIGKFSWYAGHFDDDTLQKINSSDVVAYISKDIVFQSNHYVQMNPPSWGLKRISQHSLPLGNQYSYPENSGEGVTIYVVDTGVNLKHVDLENRTTFGTAFLGNQSDETDQNGHGTFVSGVVAGKNYGVAKSANIVSVRALQPDGTGRLSTVLKAIDWISKQHLNSTNKKTIINLSLGAEYNQATNEAIQNAMKLGIHFTIAAGNEGKDACKFSPASVVGALTVGATNSDDTIASYSNTGSCVDIYAPGSNIVSLWNTSTTSTHVLSGTSMASPHVAGVMAILLSHGNYTPPELIQKIKEMGTPGNVLKTKPKKGANYPSLLLYTDGGDQSVTIQKAPDGTTNANANASSIVIPHSFFQCIWYCMVVRWMMLGFA